MKRLFGIAMLLCLLAGCVKTPALTWAEQFDSGREETASIAYIPLDDRPINTTRVELLAQSAGFRLLMPEESAYRTALDGQPANPNGTQYGDGEALLQWVERTAADYYVISVDQILSGGLVNSRWMTEITDEQQKIGRLLSALEGKQVILFDTVMRLAPTVGYGGCTLADYEALREYGKIPRPSLSGELDADLVIASYGVPTDLNGAAVSKYLAARSRKLRLSAYLLAAVSDQDNVLLYYGIDDSSPEKTVQTNEIKLIEQNMKNGHIFAGTDEMGLLAVTRAIRDHYSSGSLPSVGIRYIGADPNAPADSYDIGPLQYTVAAHLEAIGIQSASEVCDLELLIFGSGSPETLLAHWKENTEKRIPTMIVDLGEDDRLPRAMLHTRADLSVLLGYSSWNTAGNAVGIALANGVARYLYLKNELSPIKGANSGFLKGLALSFAKDISYGSIKQLLNAAEEGEALRLLQRGNDLCFEKFAAQLEGNRFLISMSPLALGTIPKIFVVGLSFPWGRTFEAELEIWIQ